MVTFAITGATSTTGVATIKECIQNKINILAFTRKNSAHLNWLPKSKFIEIIELDMADIGNFDASNLSADVFINFAWANSDPNGRSDPLKQSINIMYSIEAIRLAKRLNCKKFIGVGSQAECGRTNTVLTENTICNPITPYGIIKLATERLSRIECKKLELEYIWVRILSIYGRRDHKYTLISKLIANAKNDVFMPLTGCEQTWDYLFEDDAGKAFFKIAQHGKNNRIYNLGSGNAKKLKEYVQQVIDIVNPDYKPGFGQCAYGDIHPFYLVADIEPITKDTGWIPETSFSGGISSIVNDYERK